MYSFSLTYDDPMYRKLVLVLICQVALSLGMSACSSAESSRPAASSSPKAPAIESPESVEEPTEKLGPPSDVVSQLIRTALQSDGSLTHASLIQRLGTPQRVESVPVANQYVEGQIDTLHTLVYTGVEALVYDVTNESKSFLVRLSLSSTQYATPEGLRVGLSEKRALDRLGPPTRRNDKDGELIYEETEPTPTSMVVQIRNGRIARIDWEFYFT